MNIKNIVKYNKYYTGTITNNKLFNINIEKPECQRTLDHDQVNNILKFQLDHKTKYGEFFFSNPITLAEFETKMYIIDGQHRLNCIEKLNNMFKDLTFDILVTVLNIETKEELDEKYIAINQNKPVPLPTNLNEWKNFTRHIEEYITSNFKPYFSKSENPQIPNFNDQKLIRYINDNNIAKKATFNYKLFIVELINLNTFYLQSYTTFLKPFFKNNIFNYVIKSKEKNINKPFILSIFRNFEWVDRIVYKMNSGISYEEMKHVPTHFRQKIKKGIRKNVWEKYNKEKIEGLCFVCRESLHYDDFDCGHIKSVFYGGETNISNLLPVCKRCNNDMGIHNLYQYKTEYNIQNQN